MIPDPGGQLAELIVYISSTGVYLYSHQILLQRLESQEHTSVIFTKTVQFSYIRLESRRRHGRDAIFALMGSRQIAVLPAKQPWTAWVKAAIA